MKQVCSITSRCSGNESAFTLPKSFSGELPIVIGKTAEIEPCVEQEIIEITMVFINEVALLNISEIITLSDPQSRVHFVVDRDQSSHVVSNKGQFSLDRSVVVFL